MNTAEQDKVLQNFRAIADAIATLFFPHAEVVLHDLRTQKVDYIANNLSKRAIGDDSALEDMLSDDIREVNIGPYEKLNWDGQKIRSLSTVLRDHKGRPLAVLLMDIDQFKAVNDSLGHAAGDGVLKHLATRARLVLRGEDVLGRLGGDEFVALLPSTDVAGARIVAERLREAVNHAHMLYRGEEVPVPVSIGVAQAGDDEPLEAVLQRADQAMYLAKRAGGDQVAVAPTH